MRLINKKNLILFFMVLFFRLLSCNFSYSEKMEMPELVAHAGGGINNIVYANSREALDYNYSKGLRFFEIDFDWTRDGELVLIHYWGKDTLERLFNVEAKVYSLKEFKSFKMISDMTQMALVDLIGWLEKHKDAYVVTDVKSDNIKALGMISGKYPGFKKRFIPQIYKYEEYNAVKKMGFENIIFTLYVMNYPDREVIDFLKTRKVSALTIWHYRVNKDFMAALKGLGVFVYAHTVNDPEAEKSLRIWA